MRTENWARLPFETKDEAIAAAAFARREVGIPEAEVALVGREARFLHPAARDRVAEALDARRPARTIPPPGAAGNSFDPIAAGIAIATLAMAHRSAAEAVPTPELIPSTFEGRGGEFGGAGASGSFEDAVPSADDLDRPDEVFGADMPDEGGDES